MFMPRRVRTLFGEGALDWFNRAYAIDWFIVCILWFISEIISRYPAFEREFSSNDPLISHPYTKQQISGSTNNLVSLLVPSTFVCVAGVMLASAIEVHHGMLGLWSARALTRLITEFLKNRVGRLRPDFLSRCKWDTALQICTGKMADVLDGRRSFPSGHSSTIFAGMGFLSFWFAGKTAAWCFDSPSPPRSIIATKLGRFTLTMLPLLYATWVAVSRVEDYRHHKEDVIVGSLIGLSASTLCYNIYWVNPFSRQNFEKRTINQPRMLYSNSDNGSSRNSTYELTRLEDDDREHV